jgi:hypothetical protein
MERQAKKWRIFKERVSPLLTDPMWAVWSPDFEETLFESHAEAIDYLSGIHISEYPHCNSEVLHAPRTCHYCDAYPNRQAMRAASSTPFTPPEANGWSGNVAVRAGETHTHMGIDYIVGSDRDTSST